MNAIAAMDLNRGIGYKGNLPWKCTDDLKFFREMTWNKNLVMGHDTFRNVGTLKNRFIYVLTSNQGLLSNGAFKNYQYISNEALVQKMKDPIWRAITFVCVAQKHIKHYCLKLTLFT